MKGPVAVTLPTEQATAEEVLGWGLREFGDRLALCTGFQAEGIVLLDMASKLAPGGFRVLTIDTGRLPEETHELISVVRQRYGVSVEVIYPERSEVESMVTSHGPNLFYEAVAKRRLCCEIRKVRPLARKLSEYDAWAVGLRRQQSTTRRDVKKVEIDARHGGILKLSPLADWTEEQVREYTQRHHLPVHKLYAKGYTSIGCAPCSRAILEGEDHRAGRWWWERDATKECGINFSTNGVARRELDVLLEDILRPAR
jgi:thioredoxin-dependent adenylylsulfate APS reductase